MNVTSGMRDAIWSLCNHMTCMCERLTTHLTFELLNMFATVGSRILIRESCP